MLPRSAMKYAPLRFQPSNNGRNDAEDERRRRRVTDGWREWKTNPRYLEILRTLQSAMEPTRRFHFMLASV